MTLPLFPSGPLIEIKTPTLRPYQQRAIESVRAHVKAGVKRILVVGPTGMGKMVLIAAIARTATVPVLFVAHRLELIDQCARELGKQGLSHVGVIRGDDAREDPSATIQVASIQSLARRQKPPAGIVFIDEAHRSATDSYADHVFAAYPDAVIIGFTASPCRQDGRPLGERYQKLEIVATYGQLIKLGFVIPPQCFSSPYDPDLSSVRVAGGDFDVEQLGEVMLQKTLVGNLVDHWFDLSNKYPKPGVGYTEGPRRRTFLFATTIRHSKEIVARFQERGVRIAHLDGDTPEAERRDMLRAIAARELEIISNCNVLLEGVDVPSVKCVAHARPTHSLVLFMQSCGRIMRPWCELCDRPPHECGHPSIPPLLLDHAGNVDRHGLPHEDRMWSLADKPARVASRTPTKKCKQCYAYVPAGRTICPHCGYEFPASEALRPPGENDTRLVERTGEGARQAFYEAQVNVSRIKGFKPGYASAMYKEKYGEWPPRAWGEATKVQFVSDTRWQAALAYREAGKKENSDHHCHAFECKVHCKPEKLMCAAHWRRVPRDLQEQVYATYRDGQCQDRNPSAAWMAAADRAIAAVAAKEGHANAAAHFEDQARRWDERATMRAERDAPPGDGSTSRDAAAGTPGVVDPSPGGAGAEDYDDDFTAWLESEGIG